MQGLHVLDEAGPRRRETSPRLLADRAEARRLAPLRARIGGWQARAAHLNVLAVSAHALGRSESARRDAVILCGEVTSAITQLDGMAAIEHSTGSRTADVRKSLAALAEALRRI